MELTKTKHKKTEIGLIPDDWEIKKLVEIGSCIIGLTYSPSNVVKDGTLVLRSSNVQENKLAFYDNVYVNSVIPNNLRVREGDILICVRNGSRNLIGKCAILDKRVEGQSFGAFMSVFRTEHSSFVFQMFQSNDIKRQIDENLGATINQITNKVLNSFVIAFPTQPEERKIISNTLCDVDDLINNLEKLIAKKKAIKQGAMQQLLTPPNKGGKRLAGFNGEWVTVDFNDVCWYQEGPGLRNWQFTTKGMKVINVTNLVNGYLDLDKTERHISLDEFNKMYQHFAIDEGDIVVASSGNSYCKTAVVRKKDLPLVMNTSVIRFKPKPKMDCKMLLVYIKSKLFKDQIDLLITGGAQPNFGPAHLTKIKMNLPPTIEEQREIANILYEMDEELEQLEVKKAKYQNIKQGMMQELLTGKTRLI